LEACRFFLWDIWKCVYHDVCLSLRRPGFDPGPIRVRFMVDQVVLDQVADQAIWFCSVSIIPPKLHTNLHLHATRIWRTVEWSLRNFRKSDARTEMGHIGRKSAVPFFKKDLHMALIPTVLASFLCVFNVLDHIFHL
jgi:hypothetical protein